MVFSRKRLRENTNHRSFFKNSAGCYERPPVTGKLGNLQLAANLTVEGGNGIIFANDNRSHFIMKFSFNFAMGRIVSLAACLVPCALFAGNWALDSGTLTSDDGWAFASASLSGTTLTIGNCTSAASDGILDLRSAVVAKNGVNTTISTVTFASGTSWSSAAIKEFYCDTLSQVIASICKDNTTIEKFIVSALPSNKRTLGSYAFSGCTSLVEVRFGSTIAMSDSCFDGCRNLDVDIATLLSKGLTSTTKRSFRNCAKVHGKLHLTSVGNFQSSGDVFNGCGIEELVIESENITGFSTAPFSNCLSLTNVTIKSNSFTSIPGSAIFNGCTSLEKVRLEVPNVRTYSGGTGASKMFNGCTKLYDVTIVGSPWKDASGNGLTEAILNKHIFCSVGTLANSSYRRKLYALRSEFKNFASEMTATEKASAPRKCYGVYANAESSNKRVAYMVQDPDYRSGFIISAK